MHCKPSCITDNALKFMKRILKEINLHQRTYSAHSPTERTQKENKILYFLKLVSAVLDRGRLTLRNLGKGPRLRPILYFFFLKFQTFFSHFSTTTKNENMEDWESLSMVESRTLKQWSLAMLKNKPFLLRINRSPGFQVQSIRKRCWKHQRFVKKTQEVALSTLRKGVGCVPRHFST